MKPLGVRGRIRLLGVIAAIGLLGVTGYVVWRQRQIPDTAIAPIEDIARALRQRLGLARTAELLKPCTKRSCTCVETAAQVGLEAAPKSVLALLDVTGKRCDNSALPAIRVEAEARSGKWREARERAAAITKREPRNAFANEAAAYSYFVEGDMKHTLDLATEAERNGRGSAAPVLAGLAALRQHDFSTAAQAFTRALKLEAADMDALYNYALAMQQSGRFLEPREAYLQLLRQRPDYHQARYNLVVLLHDAGALPEARHQFEKLAQADPRSPDLIRLGTLLTQPPSPGAIPLTPVAQDQGPQH